MACGHVLSRRTVVGRVCVRKSPDCIVNWDYASLLCSRFRHHGIDMDIGEQSIWRWTAGVLLGGEDRIRYPVPNGSVHVLLSGGERLALRVMFLLTRKT